jgi:glycosyltransferase involved in cell wall biosynthesis
MRGFRESSGEYVCFVDSDDKLVPTRFEQQIKILDEEPDVGIVYGNAFIMDENGKTIGRFSDIYPPYVKNVARNLFCKHCFIPAITVTFRRNVFEETGDLWGPDANCDYLKWIEIALLSKVVYIPSELGYWRRHSRSVSLSADVERSYLEMFDALKQLRDKHIALRNPTKICALRRYGRIYFIVGFFCARNRNFKKAREYFLRASLQYPAGPENWTALLLSLPLLNLISGFIFDWIDKRIYKWR